MVDFSLDHLRIALTKDFKEIIEVYLINVSIWKIWFDGSFTESVFELRVVIKSLDR